MEPSANVITPEDSLIDSILSELPTSIETVAAEEAASIDPDEILENADEGDIDAAVAAAENADVLREHYDRQPATDMNTELPVSDEAGAAEAVAQPAEPAPAPEVEETPAAVEEPKKAKGKGKPKKDAKPATEAKPKKERKYYANKVDRIKDTLGAKLPEFTILTLPDALLPEEEQEKKRAETLEIIQAMGTKQQNRASLLMTFLHTGNKLNNVIEQCFRVLAKDGKIVPGDAGNFHQHLLKKPYAPSAARAMGNNTVQMLFKLKVLTKTEDGHYVGNPDSLILAKVNAAFGL